MATQDIARLARLPHEAYNAREFERVVSLCTDDYEFVNHATGQTFRGPEGARNYMQGWADAFPDSRTEIRSIVAGEDGFAVEFIGRGTHTGPLVSPAGTIPPTRRKVELAFCEVYRVRDGRFAGGGLYFDLATMLRELGLATPLGTMRETAGAAG